MFADWDRVPEWLRPLVEIAVDRGLIHGYPDGTIRVDTPVTRGELIAAIAKLAQMAEETDDQDRIDLMRQIAGAVVEVRSSAGVGSGVLLSGGRVLTNAHVVGADTSVLVRWTSPFAPGDRPTLYGQRYPVVRRDAALDLALVDVSALGLTDGYVELAEDWASPDLAAVDRAHYGETIYTQGSPVGLPGVLSAGLFAGHRFFGTGGPYLVFAGGINPGNSGGRGVQHVRALGRAHHEQAPGEGFRRRLRPGR